MRAFLSHHSPRELATLASLATALVLLTVLAQPYLPPPPRAGPPPPALSIHSSESGGARALFLWLADLGYRPAAIEYRPFGVDPAARLLFVLAPSSDLPDAHVSEIVRWVERGGNLVVATQRPNRLLDRLGVEVATRGAPLAEAVPRQPVFRDPPVGRVQVSTRAALHLVRPEWVPILGAPDPEGDVIAAVAAVGRGRALVLASHEPLSNSGLGQADNGKLILNFLAAVPPGSTLAFDEYHHGLTEHGTLGARLLAEPWGWAVLYAGGLLFAYVALRGRRFGRALPIPLSGVKRSRAEYVATLAGLLRQGGHREWLREHFVAQTKRALGSRYRIPADLPAAGFVAALAAQRPEAAALAGPLGRLERDASAGEGIIVALMREVDSVRTRLLGS